MKKVHADKAAMILIDHQVGTMHWVNSVDRATVAANTRALAKAAIALGMPVVLTSSQEGQMQGSLIPALQDIAPEAYADRIKRTGIVNCWEDSAFSKACQDTGRNQFIMAGVTTEVCLAPPAICAVEEGFEVFCVVDASGSPSVLTDEMAFRRMERAGVELTTTSAIMSELAMNWESENGVKLLQIMTEEILSAGH